MKKVKTKRSPKDQESLMRKAHKDLEIEYLRRFKYYFDSIFGKGYFEKVDKKMIRSFYLMRIHMPVFIYKDETAFSPQKKKYLKKSLEKALKETDSIVEFNGKYLKMDEFLGSWSTYKWLSPTILYPDCIKMWPHMESVFMEHSKKETKKDRSYLTLDLILLNMSYRMSSPGKIVNLKFEIADGEFMEVFRYKQYIHASIYYSDVRYFNSNDKSRPAYRLGLNDINNDFQWISINGEQLNLKSEFWSVQFNVYVQSHALHRFSERMEGLRNYELLFHLYSSFIDTKIIKYKNSYLLEYLVGDFKVGYFVGEIIDNCFLLKTFLMLTQVNTPEGDALSEKLATSKDDIEFLNIGRLKTFINMSTQSADEMYEHFAGTGCEKILDFKKEVLDPFFDEAYQEISLTKYLNLDKTDEELDELLESKADELGYNFRNLRLEKALKAKIMKG